MNVSLFCVNFLQTTTFGIPGVLEHCYTLKEVRPLRQPLARPPDSHVLQALEPTPT